MRHTYQMKRYMSIFSAVALSACLLIGCTRADSGSSSQNAAATQTAAGQSTVQGKTSEQSLAGAGSQNQTNSSTAVKETTSQSTSTQAVDDKSAQTAQTAQSVSGTTTQTAPAASTQPAVQETAPSQYDSDLLTDEEMDAEGAPSEIYSGEYIRSDGEESVIISLMDGAAVSFSFVNSGISSTAQINGTTAVYNGDDGYTITFDFSINTLGVSTSSPDGEGSMMDGIYSRIQDGGDSVDDAEGDLSADTYVDEDDADDFIDVSAE